VDAATRVGTYAPKSEYARKNLIRSEPILPNQTKKKGMRIAKSRCREGRRVPLGEKVWTDVPKRVGKVARITTDQLDKGEEKKEKEEESEQREYRPVPGPNREGWEVRRKKKK